MKRTGVLLATIAVISMVAVGCTTTTTQKGAGIGAAAGALIGQAAGRNTKSTIIGAAAGGLTGALVGDVVQQQQQKKAKQEATEARKQSETQQYQEAESGRRTATTFPSGQYQVDPTAGEFNNNTRWNVRVYVDAPTKDLKNAPQLSLGPNETAPANLDVGEHKVIAIAYVNTQYGERLVGSHESVFHIAPRGQGWKVAFNESSFR